MSQDTLFNIQTVYFSDGFYDTQTQALVPNSLVQAVESAYQGVLRSSRTDSAANTAAIQIADGQTTLPQFETGLITGAQALYTTLPALVTIDAYYDATPQSSTLTAVAASTGSPAHVGGFYAAAYLENLGYSVENVWTIMASQWGADPNSAFYKTYEGYGDNYAAFISAVYDREFGFAPSAPNLVNLLEDVSGVQNLLAGPGGAATPIQVVSGIYGYLLYVGQTTPSLPTQYASSADAFLQAAANGTVTYGPELTQEFPPTTGAVTSATTSSSSQIVAAGTMIGSDPTTVSAATTSSDAMTFLGGSASSPSTVTAVPGETFVAENGTNAQINGFSIAQGDTLDLTALLNGVSPNLLDVGDIGNYVSLATPMSDGSGGWITDLTIRGPGGSALVALDSSTDISSMSQLYAALTLPPH